MNTSIKPIETIYDGFRFRSRLEARWAVFLNALHVPFEYEPEGYELPNGDRYLPDFRVKCYGTRGCKTLIPPFNLWIEVKGDMDDTDRRKLIAFSGYREMSDYGEIENPILVVTDLMPDGHPFDPIKEWSDYAQKPEYDAAVPYCYSMIDGDFFGAYPAADENGHFYLWGEDSNYINRDDVPRVNDAYKKARMARFEFGEKG